MRRQNSSIMSAPRGWTIGVAVVLFSALSLSAHGAPAPAPASPTVIAEVDEAALERRALDALQRIEGLDEPSVEMVGGGVVVRGVADDSGVIDRAVEAAARATGLEVDEVDNQIRLTLAIDERVRGASNRLGERLEAWLAYLPLIPLALGIMAVFVAGAWLLGRFNWLYARLTRNPFLREIARRLVQLATLVAGALLALEVLDAMALIGGVLGAAGVVGIAIGFAFRDLVENYIASILLSLRQPFRMQDHVVIDGHEGLVSGMNTRTTLLTTFDGNIVRIPNAIVFKTALINYRTDPRRRFHFDVGVGYDVDLAEAIEVGSRVIAASEGVLREPAPFGIVEKLGDSNVTVRLFGWMNQTSHDFARVRSAAMQRVKAEFDRLDIDMPEPTYNLKVLRTSGGAAPSRQDQPANGAAPRPSKVPDHEAVHRVTRDYVIENLSRETEDGEGENLLEEDAREEQGPHAP